MTLDAARLESQVLERIAIHHLLESPQSCALVTRW